MATETIAGQSVTVHDMDADAILDYGVIWSDWLPAGAEIATSTWIADTGATVSNESIGAATIDGVSYAAGQVASCIISLTADAGALLRVTNRVTTNTTPALRDDRSFYIRVVEK